MLPPSSGAENYFQIARNMIRVEIQHRQGCSKERSQPGYTGLWSGEVNDTERKRKGTRHCITERVTRTTHYKTRWSMMKRQHRVNVRSVKYFLSAVLTEVLIQQSIPSSRPTKTGELSDGRGKEVRQCTYTTDLWPREVWECGKLFKSS
jgi:hypothetical protein